MASGKGKANSKSRGGIMNKKIFLFTALSCLWFFPGVVFAAEIEQPIFVIPPGKWWVLPEIAEKLNLNEGEKKKLEEMFVEYRRVMIDFKGAVEKEWLDLDLLLEKDPLDEGIILERHKKLEATRSQFSRVRFKFLLDIRKILGKDRYLRLKTIYREYKQK